MYIVNLLYILVLICVLIAFFYIKFDSSKIAAENNKIIHDLRDPKLEALINGSGIYNIPNLDINSANQAIVNANECGKRPLRMDVDNLSDAVCVKTCLNSSATVLSVRPDTSYIVDGVRLEPGNYCRTGPRPQCSERFTHILMTVNSVTCVPRFPRLIGGTQGDTIVACPTGKLLDEQNGGDEIDLTTVLITDEDEKMPDGSYRFHCNHGVDERKNPYLDNQNDRFLPIENKCARHLTGAHEDVKLKVDERGQEYCDCGNPEETRVKNLIPGYKWSACVAKNLTIEYEPKTESALVKHLPINCYNGDSLYTDMYVKPLCSDANFDSNLDSISFRIGKHFNVALEYPELPKLPKGGALRIAW